MSSTAAPLLRTPLNDLHRRLGARMVDFAGWDMPVQYRTGIIAEHQAVRTACGLFDLSHMGRVYVRGRDAFALAQYAASRDLSRIPAGEAAYSLLCNERGGVIDDVIGYVLGPEEILFVFNASNREKDIAAFERYRNERGLDASIEDRTFETALIGVQGPNAQAVLQPLVDVDLDAMPGFSFRQGRVAGAETLVARTGYTGEDGFELMVPADQAEAVWQALAASDASVMACGLGARDTLRTEAAMPLYGHEIDDETSPYEARLGWAVSLGKDDFAGRSALQGLKEQGPSQKLVGLRVGEGGVPRPEFPVLHDGARAGQITSGTFSPSLRQNIALAYVPVGLDEVGQRLDVEARGKPVAAEVVALPFVPHRTRPRARKA